MRYEEFKNLKSNFNNVMYKTQIKLIQEDAPSNMYFILLEKCVKRISIEFLKEHNIYNTTYEKEMIEYLLDKSDFFPVRFSRICEKTYA